MNTVLTFKHTHELSLPACFKKDDVRFSDDLARYLIEQFSRPGDVVFDPFAGFGTTLYQAEKLGRIGYGIEYLADMVSYIQSIIENKENIFCGSALHADRMNLPMIDLLLTSPPYMAKNNHPEYPFAAYQVTGAGYGQYLADIKSIFAALKRKMKPGGYTLIEVSNIIHEDVLTTLAWDVAKSVSEVLTLKKEIILRWESEKESDAYGFGYDHSYCLVYQNL